MFEKEYSLLEALAECYSFKPKKRKNSKIIFEVTVPNQPDEWFRFGKIWHSHLHEWNYIEWVKNCPTLGCEERHFVSNLMSNSFARTWMTYSAQQGTFKVRKIFDSRIDTQWHNASD